MLRVSIFLYSFDHFTIDNSCVRSYIDGRGLELTTVFFNSQCPSPGRPFYLASFPRVATRVRRSISRMNRHNVGVLDTEGKAP
jgi:hypothetical protein